MKKLEMKLWEQSFFRGILRSGCRACFLFKRHLEVQLCKATKLLRRPSKSVEEMVEGRKLTDIINEDHQNVRYLPGVELPHNLPLT